MIDIHTHILPGMDDGAEDLSVSIKMAEVAFAAGYTQLIATPHHLKGDYVNTGEAIRRKCAMLNIHLAERGVAVKVYPGQEVRIHGELMEGLKKGEVIPLADSRYILIEFSTNYIPIYTEKLFFELQVAGYVPIIAHPERNQVFQKNMDRLMQLVEQGALTQLTLASSSDYFGRSAKKAYKKILNKDLAHFLASDAHDIKNRSFESLATKKQLKKAYLTSEKYQELADNSVCVIKNELLEL